MERAAHQLVYAMSPEARALLLDQMHEIVALSGTGDFAYSLGAPSHPPSLG